MKMNFYRLDLTFLPYICQFLYYYVNVDLNAFNNTKQTIYYKRFVNSFSFLKLIIYYILLS